MIRDRTFIFIGFQLFLTIILIKINGLEVLNLYYGVKIGSIPMLYFVYIGQFINLCMYMFGGVEEYLTGYGIYTLIRLDKRTQLQKKIKTLLLKKLLIYELAKAGICCFISLFFSHAQLQLEKVVAGLVFTFIVNYICLIFQAILEIKVSARIGVLITSSLYIAMLLLPDLLMMGDKSLIYFMFLIPNLSMCNRVDLSYKTYFVIMIWFTFIIICLWSIFMRMINKKDIF